MGKHAYNVCIRSQRLSCLFGAFFLLVSELGTRRSDVESPITAAAYI